MRKSVVILLVLLAVAGGTLAALGYIFYESSNTRSQESSPAFIQPTTSTPTKTPLIATPTEQPANMSPTELRVFVAASLTNVVKKHAEEKFEKENNVKLLFNFGGSDALYQQIAAGSPADVFMAADFKWTKQLKQDNLLYDDRYWNFTTNKLILIMPADNPENITSLLDLTEPETRIVVAGWTVPVGKYTNITLAKIQKTWGNRSDPNYKGPEWNHYRDRVVNNIISYEPTVSHVVTKVLIGVADAGFAYITDVKFQATKLKYVEIPDAVNTKGTYGIAVITSSANSQLAVKYVEFWLSKEGQQFLADYGFGVDR